MTDQHPLARSAAAIAQAGSPAFTLHAGPTLELMSEQAKAGELEAMSQTLLAHIEIHPGDRRSLIDRVPAKILNQYIYILRQRSVGAVERWRERTPDWAETLKRAVTNPQRFAMVAKAMADAAGRSELS